MVHGYPYGTTVPPKINGWIGHTLRKDEQENFRSAVEQNPRPKTSWRGTVLKESGQKSFDEIRALAKDRREWKHHMDDLCVLTSKLLKFLKINVSLGKNCLFE